MMANTQLKDHWTCKEVDEFNSERGKSIHKSTFLSCSNRVSSHDSHSVYPLKTSVIAFSAGKTAEGSDLIQQPPSQTPKLSSDS